MRFLDWIPELSYAGGMAVIVLAGAAAAWRWGRT